MKRHTFALLFLAMLLLSTRPGLGQGTAFTYQGRLADISGPVNGSYDLRLALFDAASGGIQQGPLLTNAATIVTNGLFLVTVDFGNQFTGAGRWLELAVRTNGNGAFNLLTPRQAITTAPYASMAANAVNAGYATVAANVPATGIGSGTANINISGNAATATTAATAGLAATATTATSATSAGSATTANFATSATYAGTATNLAGVLPDAQHSPNIVRLNGTNIFSGTNTFSNVVIATNPANQITGTFTGSGAGLTGLTSVSLAPGSITAAMLMISMDVTARVRISVPRGSPR